VCIQDGVQLKGASRQLRLLRSFPYFLLLVLLPLLLLCGLSMQVWFDLCSSVAVYWENPVAMEILRATGFSSVYNSLVEHMF